MKPSSLLMGVFYYETISDLFDYLIMKVLRPIATEQTLLLVPREYLEASDLQIVLTKDGTQESETLTGVVSTTFGNYISVTVSFSILVEGDTYFLEMTQGSKLLYRDKVFCTAQADKSVLHTLNENQYDQHESYPADQQYITL
jgi:hypothetical protein